MSVVTIITPTKNRLSLLQEAMASVKAQAYDLWEHVIVDDGSIDGSREYVAAQSATDPRIRLIVRDGVKSGANVCRNLGLREARGDYVVFLDSDDVLAPQCLKHRVETLERNADLDFVVHQTGYFVNQIGDRRQQEPCETFGDDLLRFLTFEIPWIITAPTWRVTALQRLSGFDEALPSWQDIDLHLRAICQSMKYLKIARIDHHVRWLDEEARISIQQRKSPDHLKAAEKLLQKFEEIVHDGPGMDWSRQRAICGLYFFLAELWQGINQNAETQRCWRLILNRQLGTASFYQQGAWLLRLRQNQITKNMAMRLIHKWKGWVRFRTNPELIASRQLQSQPITAQQATCERS